MFKASGELDNGFTWSYFMELDGNDGGAHDNDDSQLAIGMGDMGTLNLTTQKVDYLQRQLWVLVH